MVESLAYGQNQSLLDKDNVLFGWNVDDSVDFDEIEEIEAASAEDDVNDARYPTPFEVGVNANIDNGENDNIVTDDKCSVDNNDEIDGDFANDEVYDDNEDDVQHDNQNDSDI